jgi:hypothetical protein
MLSKLRLSCTRLTGGTAAIAAFSLAILGIAGTEGQAAGGYRADNGKRLSSPQDRALNCDAAGSESRRFVVGDETSQIREIRMCTKANSTEARAEARHLASGLMQASIEYRGGGEPQSSELAASRISKDGQVGKPASFDELVKMLEANLATRPD